MTKSKVCTMANALVSKGYTKSEAFTKAWAIVKAEAISDKLHVLSLSTDRYNTTERTTVADLNREHTLLMNKANSIQTAAEAAAIAARNQKISDDYNRAEDIRFELGCLVRKGQMNSALYNDLRAELKAIAA